MTLLLNILLSVAFAGAVGGAVHYWRTQLDTARRDGMQALAARRGWALTVTGERLGRAGTLRLVPRGGHPWVTETRPKDEKLGGESITEYEAEEPRWTEGTLVLIAVPSAIGAGEELDAAVERPPLEERALRELFDDSVARSASHLRPVPAPEGITALSSGDPTRRVDLQDLSRVLQAWSPLAAGPQGQPVLILSPEGMRLRLRQPVRRPDQMEKFLDLAMDLTRLIGP